MTLPLLNAFLEELLADRQFIRIRDTRIVELIKHIDKEERFWHVTTENMLWPIAVWRADQENIKARRAQYKLESERIEARKQGYYRLMQAIAKDLRGDPTDAVVRALAERIVKENKVGLAAMFGVDLSELPVLDKPYINITEGIEL